MDIGPRYFSAPETDKADRLVVFSLDEGRYALRLAAVGQIVRAVEITPLPQAPGIILGIVNVQGRIVPVFDIRKRFRLPERETALGDHLLLARTARREVAFVADRVLGVVTRAEEEMTRAERIVPGLDYVEGVVKLDDGLVFIHDLDTFLSVEEQRTLESALTCSCH